jgi:hypothetical protein
MTGEHQVPEGAGPYSSPASPRATVLPETAMDIVFGSPPDPTGSRDALRLQILTTEHASLLSTRENSWNEVFSRAGTFLTVLSAAVVALALAAQAAGFGSDFRLFALLVLPVALLVGVGTFVRLCDIAAEDAHLVVGMNRLRHAYLELAPELEPYFVTGWHDDEAGVMQTYSFTDRIRPSRVLAGTPTLVGLIDAVLAGVLLALAAVSLGATATIVLAAGLLGAVVTAVVLAVIPFRIIAETQRTHPPRFPR